MARKRKQVRTPGLRPFKRGNVWYAVGTLDGKPIRESLRTASKLEADRKCLELQADIQKRNREQATKGKTFAEAAVHYIDFLDTKNKRKKEVRGSYTFPHRMYDRIIKQIGETYLCDITTGFITDTAMAMLPNATGAHRNRHVICPIVATVRFAAKRNWCAPVIGEREEVVKVPKTYVSREWLDKFMAAARELELSNIGVAALFMFTTGARRNDVTVLEVAHLNLSKRKATLPSEWMKNGEEGAFMLTQELVAELRAILPESGRVFGLDNPDQIYKPWRAICKHAGVKYVPPHQAGRHSFGTHMGRRIGKDIDLATAAKIGRWKDKRVLLDDYMHEDDDLLRSVDSVFETETKGLKTIKGGKE